MKERGRIGVAALSRVLSMALGVKRRVYHIPIEHIFILFTLQFLIAFGVDRCQDGAGGGEPR